jgi:hypothetical protein
MVENHLEVHLMEDHQEEDHLIETHMDCHQIHMLDFMDGRHPIQGYLCRCGTNWFWFYLTNQYVAIPKAPISHIYEGH